MMFLFLGELFDSFVELLVLEVLSVKIFLGLMRFGCWVVGLIGFFLVFRGIFFVIGGFGRIIVRF